MSGPNNIFELGSQSMSAQMVRMNTLASNIANAGTVASSPDTAYKALRPVFETVYNDAKGTTNMLSTTKAVDVVALDREPEALYRPDHPQADKNGFVYASTVNVEEEMVEMLESSRQYQNTLEAVTTLRTLMARTVGMGK